MHIKKGKEQLRSIPFYFEIYYIISFSKRYFRAQRKDFAFI